MGDKLADDVVEDAAGGLPDRRVATPGSTTLGDESTEESAPEQVALAAEVRRLGNLVLGRKLPPEQADAVAEELAAIADRLEERPPISKVENVYRRNRIATFLESGEWPEPPPNGSRLEFDPASVVGGELNPFGMGARYYREGDEAVGFANLGPCFEGPPERVHGGVICAIFDEVMGSVFRATGTPSAFTGELTVRFEAPAPLGIELEFRARRVASEGRRQMLEGEARSPEGQFASAKAIFIEMRPEQIPTT